ncbi:MAG TPA: hypothetical protein VFB99_20190, partial [Vicinamibacterales bacterium]|nr:hypothetical protein [Vicinamibacterales bacterium]
VTVRGNVTGDLLTGAEIVRVEGSVGGNIIGFGRAVTVTRSRVGRNLYGFGRDIDVAADSDLNGNAITFGENVDMAGRVGIDLKGFASNVTVSGNVERDVEAFAAKITLLPSARVGRNLTVHTDDADDLQIAAGALVTGSVDRQVFDRQRERERNPYLTVGFYVGQIVRLGAAFLTGLVLLRLFPTLRSLSLPDGMAALRTAGIGLVAAVTLPVAALLACITIVGLPIGVATFVVGAIGLYFAKTVVAQLIGRALFHGPQGVPHYAATLLAGLTIIIVAINIPFIGGWLNLAATLLGLGMIVTVLFAHFGRGATA